MRLVAFRKRLYRIIMNGERGLPERERVILFFFIVNISYNLLQLYILLC
jgi:hypothetical protein